MNLPFNQFFDKQETQRTYFAEKMFAALHFSVEEVEAVASKKYSPLNYMLLTSYFQRLKTEKFVPKIHTLRQDEKNIWKGNKPIHPVYFNRTPRRFQFLPTFDCTGTQEISIYPSFGVIEINGRALTTEETALLIKNDGFDNEEQFWAMFTTSFWGKIIHFTDFKYDW
jgi:hypothetical protein